MRTMILSSVAVALALPAVAGGAPLTDLEVLQKRVGKIAAKGGDKPKTLCYCVAPLDSAFRSRVGFIRQFVGTSGSVHLQCEGDTFDANGNDVGGFGCPDFRVLVK